jgi:serine/threonine protein kinase
MRTKALCLIESFFLILIACDASLNEITNMENSVSLIKEISAASPHDFSQHCEGNFMTKLAEKTKYVPAFPRHSVFQICQPRMFRVLDEIGSGSFATVYKSAYKPTDLPVALKSIIRAKTDLARIRMEECLQHQLRLPTIREHYCTYLMENRVVLVMEYVDGMTLSQYVKAHHPVSHDLLKKWAAQLAVTLIALHQRSIVFVDLKPKNILVTKDGNIKLIDFGLSTPADLPLEGLKTIPNLLHGTPYYSAPETTKDFLAKRQDVTYYRPSSDWYALGVVLYRAATRKHLYGIKELNKMRRMQPHNQGKALTILFGRIQEGVQITADDRTGREELMDFIASITVTDPEQRLGTSAESYHKILSSPIFRDHADLKQLIGIKD